MALTALRTLDLLERRRFFQQFGPLGVGHVAPHPALYALKMGVYLTLAAVAIGGLLAGYRLLRRYRAMGVNPWPEPPDRAVLLLGATAAAISGAGIYFYLVSVYLLPLFVVLFFIAYRRFARSSSRRGASLFGIWLAGAAFVMPITSGASWWLITAATPRGSSLTSGEPFFYAIFTPPVAVLIVSVFIAWRLDRMEPDEQPQAG